MPVYSISDSRTWNRMLKCTPELMHCFGTFYRPLIATGTPFLCVATRLIIGSHVFVCVWW
jgi:hypothetical protein